MKLAKIFNDVVKGATNGFIGGGISLLIASGLGLTPPTIPILAFTMSLCVLGKVSASFASGEYRP